MLFTCCIELGYFTSMVLVTVCRDNYDDILLVILVILENLGRSVAAPCLLCMC
jgi:hypothetical protein